VTRDMEEAAHAFDQIMHFIEQHSEALDEAAA
jgi:hypothetical protein